MAKYTLYVGTNDAAALYEDGTRVAVGHYESTLERTIELLGVEWVHDDAFMRGGTKWDDSAPTLTAVEEYRAVRDKKIAESRQLRADAEKLLELARRLEKEVGK